MEYDLCAADELRQFQVPGHILRWIFVRLACVSGGAIDISLNRCGSMVGGVLRPEWAAFQRDVSRYINLPVPRVGHLPGCRQLLGGPSANANADAYLDGYSSSHTNIYAAAIYKYADGHAYADNYGYTTRFRLGERIIKKIRTLKNPAALRGSCFV